jgi:hypothetical protein
MSNNLKDAKNDRKKIYFDCICGVTCATLALIGIAYFSIMYGVTNYIGFYIGTIFWIGWLCLSLFLIGVGVYSYYLELHPEKDKKRQQLKAPVI